MGRARSCSFLYCGENGSVLDDHNLRQRHSMFEANLFTLVGPLRLRNFTVGPADGGAIRLQDVQGGRGELDRNRGPGRVPTVEIIPLPKWRHSNSAQIESGIEETVQSFADRWGSIVRLNDLIEIVDADERQLIRDKFDIPNGGPGPGKPKGTSH